MSAITIFTDQHAPNGQTIRYNVEGTTSSVAAEVTLHLANGTLMPIPNEDGGEPIFVNPERVASITPGKEN